MFCRFGTPRAQTASAFPKEIARARRIRLRGGDGHAGGIGSVVVTLDAVAADQLDRAERARAGEPVGELDPGIVDQRAKRARALRHALAEYELKVHGLVPGRSLAEGLGS